MTTATASDPALPIIDISPFLSSADSSPTARASTVTALSHACRTTGFFYLTGHGIPSATLVQILDLARGFFLESSDADKTAIARRDAGSIEKIVVHGNEVLVGGDGARGYQKIGENVTKGRRDWHEAVDLYEDWSVVNGGKAESGDVPYEVLQGQNLWPRHPPELRDLYTAYIERVKGVGTAVVRAMGEALGLGETGGEDGEDADVFVRATRGSFWVMRLIGYPGLPEGEGQEEGFSCGEHTGTFLSQISCKRTIRNIERQRGSSKERGRCKVSMPIPHSVWIEMLMKC